MLNETNVRIFLGIIGAGSVLFGPWWLPAVPIFLLSLRFRAWDAILIGLFADFLWLPADAHVPVYLLFSIFVVWACEPLRRELLLA
jgi:hypothetical protein